MKVRDFLDRVAERMAAAGGLDKSRMRMLLDKSGVQNAAGVRLQDDAEISDDAVERFPFPRLAPVSELDTEFVFHWIDPTPIRGSKRVRSTLASTSRRISRALRNAVPPGSHAHAALPRELITRLRTAGVPLPVIAGIFRCLAVQVEDRALKKDLGEMVPRIARRINRRNTAYSKLAIKLHHIVRTTPAIVHRSLLEPIISARNLARWQSLQPTEMETKEFVLQVYDSLPGIPLTGSRSSDLAWLTERFWWRDAPRVQKYSRGRPRRLFWKACVARVTEGLCEVGYPLNAAAVLTGALFEDLFVETKLLPPEYQFAFSGGAVRTAVHSRRRERAAAERPGGRLQKRGNGLYINPASCLPF